MKTLRSKMLLTLSAAVVAGAMALGGCSAHSISGPDIDPPSKTPVEQAGKPVIGHNDDDGASKSGSGGSIQRGIAHNHTGED
jgi:hypothetical protein